MTKFKTKNKATEIDTCIGKNLSHYRRAANYSQPELGDAVGISFQQIQKYEKGTNRISASRLLEFANILDVSVDQFYGEEYSHLVLSDLTKVKSTLVEYILDCPHSEFDKFINAIGRLYSKSLK